MTLWQFLEALGAALGIASWFVLSNHLEQHRKRDHDRVPRERAARGATAPEKPTKEGAR